jgi:hypothetical protein
MKIRFLRNVDVDYCDHRLDEIYPKYFQKWDEIEVDSIKRLKDHVSVDMFLSNGNVIIDAPWDVYEEIKC